MAGVAKGKTWTVDARQLLRMSAHELWLATLVGNPPPSLQKLRTRILSISLGDLVAENTTMHQREYDEYAIGRLVAHRREALHCEPEDEAEDFGRRSEEAWYLELLDGRLFRWHNASFIRVLEAHDANFAGTREARDGDANRVWIAGALARHDIDSLAAQQPWLKTPIEAVDAGPLVPSGVTGR